VKQDILIFNPGPRRKKVKSKSKKRNPSSDSEMAPYVFSELDTTKITRDMKKIHNLTKLSSRRTLNYGEVLFILNRIAEISKNY